MQSVHDNADSAFVVATEDSIGNKGIASHAKLKLTA